MDSAKYNWLGRVKSTHLKLRGSTGSTGVASPLVPAGGGAQPDTVDKGWHRLLTEMAAGDKEWRPCAVTAAWAQEGGSTTSMTPKTSVKWRRHTSSESSALTSRRSFEVRDRRAQATGGKKARTRARQGRGRSVRACGEGGTSPSSPGTKERSVSSDNGGGSNCIAKQSGDDSSPVGTGTAVQLSQEANTPFFSSYKLNSLVGTHI